jgi:hypothetical protein
MDAESVAVNSEIDQQWRRRRLVEISCTVYLVSRWKITR